MMADDNVPAADGRDRRAEGRSHRRRGAARLRSQAPAADDSSGGSVATAEQRETPVAAEPLVDLPADAAPAESGPADAADYTVQLEKPAVVEPLDEAQADTEAEPAAARPARRRQKQRGRRAAPPPSKGRRHRAAPQRERRRRTPLVAALAGLAVVLVGLLIWAVLIPAGQRVFSGGQLTTANASTTTSNLGSDADRRSATAAAVQFAADFFNSDYQKLDEYVKRVQADALPGSQFLTDFNNQQSNLRTVLTQSQAVSTGKVLAAGVAALTDQQAYVLLAVDQTVNNKAQQNRVVRYRAIVTLQRSGKDWLVANLAPVAVSPTGQSSASPAPSGAASVPAATPNPSSSPSPTPGSS